MASEGEDVSGSAVAQRCVAALSTMRRRRPLVQNITNFVAMDIAANALLAAGAAPAMVHAREEVTDFVAIADALVINIGTLSPAWIASMEAAAERARSLGKPWVLDPVGVGATPFRTATVVSLLRHEPTLLRGNASEILTVAGALGLDAAASRGKGVDSGNSAEEVASVAGALAGKLGCVVVATGATDVVSDGRREVRCANGSPLMAAVTAVGCSLSALAGAYCAVTEPFDAACAALAHMGLAGEIAADTARLPGSFRVALIDQLAALGEADVLNRARFA